MGFIPKITCRRCGREFSGLRGRCPFCGTQRVKQSDRSPAPTSAENTETPAGQRAVVNTRWQLIFGAILLVAVILSVIVLLSVSLNGTVKNSPSPTLPDVTAFNITPSPTPTPTPTPQLESINMYLWTQAIGDDFMESVGTSLTFTVQAWPTSVNIDGAVKWSTSDPSVVSIVQDGNNCTLTMEAAGTCTITVECYGATDTTTARVRG